MGKRRGGFNPICFLKGVRGGYFGFWFHDGVGSPRFFMVFSLPALVGLVSLFLKGEIEREMGRENNRGGFFAFFLRSISSCIGLYSLESGGLVADPQQNVPNV